MSFGAVSELPVSTLLAAAGGGVTLGVLLLIEDDMRNIKKGSTDQSIVIRILDSTTFLPETGVEHNSAGIDLWYRREGEASVDITEVALSALTDAHADGGIEHINDGYYRLDLPDAAVAAGANGVQIGGTITDMVVIGCYIHLTDYNSQDGVRLGLTALPNAAADAAGGLPISDAGGLDLDAQRSDVAAILVDTGTTLDGRLPAALVGGRMDANVGAISGDATAADTLELFAEALDQVTGQIDSGTFAAGAIDAAAIANGAIDAATFAADVDAEILSYIVDDATRIDASSLNTASATSIPAILADTGTDGVVVNTFTTAGKAEIEAEATDALNAYDPPTRAELTTDINSVLAKLNGLVLASGTIGATGNDTTHLHLDGLAYGDDGPNEHLLVFFDNSTSLYYGRWISDFATTGDLATITPALPVTPENSVDTYWVTSIRRDVTATASVDLATFFTTNSGETYATAVAGSVVKEIADNAGGASLTVQDIVDGVLNEATSGHTTAGTVGKAISDTKTDTTAILADTNELQTDWTNGGRLDLIVDAILVDTAEIGAAGAGLTAIQLPSNGLANVTAWTVAITGNITGNLSGSVGSVTGAVGSVTANVNAVLANTAHGGTIATLRLGGSTSTPAFYVTNSGGDAVQFEATGGNGKGLDILGEGIGHAMHLTAGSGGGDGVHSESSAGDGMHLAGSSGPGLHITAGTNVQPLFIQAAGTAPAVYLAGGSSAGTALYLVAGTNGKGLDIIGDVSISGATTFTGAITATNASNNVTLGTFTVTTNAIAWNASWDAEVQSEVDDALVAQNLDHLVKIAVDTDFATTVHVDSVVGQLAQTADGGYSRATDSLEAVRDRGDVAWVTATGFSTHTAADVWTSGTRTLTSAANITSTGGTTVPQTGDAFARLGAPAGASVSADVAAVKTDTAAVKAKTDNLPASPAAVGSAMTLADGAITEAKISTPSEASGRPTGILGMIRRIFEWKSNKRTRTRSTGAVVLRNEGDSATLETQTQSTTGGSGSEVDTQTKGV